MSDASVSYLVDVAPRLPVEDIGASLRFYEEILGFRLLESFGEPPSYATLERDEVELHLRQASGGPGASAYVWVRGLDELATELSSRKVAFEGPLERDYGMREILLRDPSGNLLTFGENTKRRTS